MSTLLKKIAAISILTFSQVAIASPIASNSDYNLSGNGVGSGEGFADTGGLFLAFYQTRHGNPAAQAGDFYVYLDLAGTMNTGNIAGNNLDSLNVSTTGNVVSVAQFDGNSWNNVSGASGSASTSILFNDITINNNNDIFALINGTGSDQNGNISLNLSFGGNSVAINQSILSSFMPFDQTTQGYYDPAINAFSNNGILDFAMAGFNGGIHSWFDSNTTVQFGGTTYFLQGDIHANYSSQVPEPASMGLLTAGLLGIIGRRKKKVLA